MSDIFVKQTLFDRIINVKLFTVGAAAAALASRGETVTLGNGQVAAVTNYVQCPPTGRKPTISIRGRILPSPILSDIELRITNLYTGDIPLDAFKYLKVEAGYAGNLQAAIEGEVVNAYQETPGPDGVTVFSMLLGFFTNWSNVAGSKGWEKGTQINLILKDCAQLLGMTLKSFLPDSLVSQAAYSFTGLVSRFVSDLAQSLGVNIFPDGSVLKAYQKSGSTDKRYLVKYLVSPPRHEAYGYNMTALWEPGARPGDILDLDTRFVRQSFGGAQVGQQQTSFIIQTITFGFSTTEDENSMNVIATAAS